MIPTKYINAGPMQAQASASAAMASGQALAKVGAAISDVGEVGLAMAEKTRKFTEAGKINAFIAKANEDASAFSIGLSKRSDTDKWSKEWRGQDTTIRERAKGLGLSDSGMADLDSQLVNWSSQQSIHFDTQANTTALGIARAQTNQSLEYFAARGNFQGFDQALQTAVNGGLLNPAEVEKAKMHRDSQAAQLDIERMARGNPESMVDFSEEEMLRQLPGATPDMVQRGKQVAKGVVRERALDLSDTAMDAVFSDQLKTPEMVDADPRFEKMRPTMKERVKDAVRQFQGDKTSDFMASPDEQARVVGNISKLISGWDPKSQDMADETSIEIQSELGRLPKGSAIRAELMRQAAAVRADTWAASTSNADAAMKALDAAGKAGRFGRVPEVTGVRTAKLVQDGFLKDASKLERQGFDATQAAQIVTAANKSDALGQGKLSELWNDRTAGNVAASEFEIAAANALRLGHPTVKGYDDPISSSEVSVAKLSVEYKVGEAKMRLADFLKSNPKATADEIDDKILEIGGEQTQRELKSGIYGGNFSRTSSVNIKLSNYGYASDTTPDSNSAKGIGHSNNQLEDGKSAAISKSLAVRLDLKTGDMVELETSKGTFRVRYDDTVPSTDSRTGDLPETIDIYRKNGSNGWGGKVLKITKVDE